jgi:hypothetical protein
MQIGIAILDQLLHTLGKDCAAMPAIANKHAAQAVQSSSYVFKIAD